MSVLLIAGGIFFYIRSLPPSRTATEAVSPLWYYDVEAARLIRHEDLLPPITVNNRELVRAYVFSCGDCGDATKRYIGYVEKFSGEAKRLLESQERILCYMGPRGLDRLNPDEIGKLLPKDAVQIRLPDKPDWMDAYDTAGIKLRSLARAKCGTVPPKECDTENFTP